MMVVVEVPHDLVWLGMQAACCLLLGRECVCIAQEEVDFLA